MNQNQTKPGGSQWKPIESAPKDGSEIIVFCPPAHGLRHMASVCSYHEAAGFCVDELREPTMWIEIPNTKPKELESIKSDTPETDAILTQYAHLLPNWLATDIMAPLAKRLQRERDEWRMNAMMKMAVKMLSCMWCGEIVHAPTGYDPGTPLTEDQRKQAYQEHTMICTAHPIRDVFAAIRNLRDVKGRHHSEQAYNKLVAMLPESNETKP